METAVLKSEELRKKILTYACLGYSPQRVANLLSRKKKEQKEIAVLIMTEGNELYEAYEQGLSIGEYNIDVSLAKEADRGSLDAIELRSQRVQEKKLADIKKELFGI